LAAAKTDDYKHQGCHHYKAILGGFDVHLTCSIDDLDFKALSITDPNI
jgi:hypothetical protein